MNHSNRGRWFAVLIVLAGFAVTVFLLGNKEEEYFSEKNKSVLTVKTVLAEKKDYSIQVPAWGFVEPRETIDIRPEISGMVTDVSDNVFAGSTVKEGDLLFRIDDRDYLNALAEAKATTLQAWQDLEIEKGRQVIARSEWEVLANSEPVENRASALALREPQLKIKEAAIQKATARQAQAALSVERSRIESPCDGAILKEHLAKGQVLDAGYTTMQIACTDCYRITAFFSQEYSLDPEYPVAKIDLEKEKYKGVVASLLPGIDPETRQRQALVTFGGENVVLGAYASLTLTGPSFSDVTVLPKEALRTDGTVWVLDEGDTLEIRNVTVLAQDPLHVVIGRDLAGHEHVILSHIATPLEGMRLQRAASPGVPPKNGVDGEEAGE